MLVLLFVVKQAGRTLVMPPAGTSFDETHAGMMNLSSHFLEQCL
jgi:hypothetical protein